jgi:poly(A) polymerase
MLGNVSMQAFPLLLQKVIPLLHGADAVYLVGGAVRDALLGIPVHDMDFVLSGKVREVARRVADNFGGDFYMLDEERQTARVLLNGIDGKSYSMDFARLRGANLEEDLCGRDFTINAIALDMNQPEQVIDPLHGCQDLKDKLLRACLPTSFEDDPARVLRAVRLALGLRLRIEADTRFKLVHAAPLLSQVSPERQRDELLRMFAGAHVSSAVRILDQIGALDVVLPELKEMKKVQQPPPHQWDVWEHTLALLNHLEHLLALLVDNRNEDKSANLMSGLAVLKLGRYRQQFKQHFLQRLNPGRERRSLLFLAALYHDLGKPVTASIDETGQRHFYGHEDVAAQRAAKRAVKLALSQTEVCYVEIVVQKHMRLHQLAIGDVKPSRKAIYHFFRDCGQVGVDLCLLALADTQAVYGATLTQEHWMVELEKCAHVLEAWWEHPQEVVHPPRLLNGDDLQTSFGLKPGRLVGSTLEALQEAQACGDVVDRNQAVEFITRWLANVDKDDNDGKGNTSGV